MNNYQHSGQQIVYVTVKIVLIGNCDSDEILENVDYNFEDPAIIETEILGWEAR
jgi:hypothetical protein